MLNATSLVSRFSRWLLLTPCFSEGLPARERETASTVCLARAFPAVSPNSLKSVRVGKIPVMRLRLQALETEIPTIIAKNSASITNSNLFSPAKYLRVKSRNDPRIGEAFFAVPLITFLLIDVSLGVPLITVLLTVMTLIVTSDKPARATRHVTNREDCVTNRSRALLESSPCNNFGQKRDRNAGDKPEQVLVTGPALNFFVRSLRPYRRSTSQSCASLSAGLFPVSICDCERQS